MSCVTYWKLDLLYFYVKCIQEKDKKHSRDMVESTVVQYDSAPVPGTVLLVVVWFLCSYHTTVGARKTHFTFDRAENFRIF